MYIYMNIGNNGKWELLQYIGYVKKIESLMDKNMEN